MVKLAEGKPVTVETLPENDFKITPEQLRAAITGKSRVLMLQLPLQSVGLRL